MPGTKICSRCGRSLPVDNFRKYYGGRTGSYKFCLTCEKIEAKRKYILRRVNAGAATALQLDDLRKIEALYATNAANGLDVPGTTNASKALTLDDLIKEVQSNGDM